jgi:hypothetical protein
METTVKEKKKYAVRLNNLDKIEQLLQETYNLACQQHTQIQNEINKIINTTKLNELDMEGKERYGKTLANYMKLQQASITQKYDIAKLMAEVVKFNGDVKGAIDATKNGPTTLDINALRDLAKKATTSAEEETQTYETKK